MRIRRWFWGTWLGGRICYLQCDHPWLIASRCERAYIRQYYRKT